MTPEVAKRLLDAHAACAAIGDFVRGLDAVRFARNPLVCAAVERKLEIIGEALGRAAADDASLAESIPEIPRIVGLRNRLIHGYDSVDDQIVWDIVLWRVPLLRQALAHDLSAQGDTVED